MAGRDTHEQAAEFVRRHGLDDLRHVFDADGQVWAAFGIGGQPAWVFIDGTTGTSSAAFGALPPEQLTRRLEELEADGDG